MHSLPSKPIICVDKHNGLYVTPKNDTGGVIHPIHVAKSTVTQIIDCENEECRTAMQLAFSLGLPGQECSHLLRANQAQPYVAQACLLPEVLEDMKTKGLLSSESAKECCKLLEEASHSAVDAVYRINSGEMGYSSRFLFFSTFTNKKDSWCRFKRTIVTFDSTAGQWSCRCGGHAQIHSCVHRNLAKWWIFQESPHLLVKRTKSHSDNIEDLDAHMVEVETPCDSYNEDESKVRLMTEYIYSAKRIPRDLPIALKTKEKEPTTFLPTETQCPYCEGPTPPDLLPHKVITTHAVVCGMTYVKKGK